VTTGDVPKPGLLDLAYSCFVGDVESAASLIVEHAAADRGGYVCLCNVHVLTTALHDSRLRRILGRAELRLPDGEPVAWLLRRSGMPHARRVGGPDLFPSVVELGRHVDLRHFLVGSTEPTLELLTTALLAMHPGAEIVGRFAPPLSAKPDIDEMLVARIRSMGAQIVWVGLGAPKQELWMERAASAMPGVTMVGVGAAFDFVSGAKPRAPEWMQRYGLEWLHRMATEPRRLTTRYAQSNSEFLARAGYELARRRLRMG
jgi:N-acetylglucosaminyldiphosphoundecaprenol N-acetyl-beta-D-mannosaminyltransferase